MHALQCGQQNDGITRAYENLLGSQATPLLFPKNHSDQEIRSVFHNSKLRLQAIYILFDVGISQRDFTLESIQDFQKDFLQNILMIVRDVPEEYFNDKKIVSQNLLWAKKPFASAIDARTAIRGKPTLNKIRTNNVELYNNLTSAASYFEAALKDWELTPPIQQGLSRLDRNLLSRLDTQKRLLKKIYDDLYIAGYDSIGTPSIERYETNLREIIESLLEIPKDDESARIYIRTKNGTINCLRKARTQLNLVLDECAFFDEGKTKDRQRLYDHLNNCIPCLEQALQLWSRK